MLCYICILVKEDEYKSEIIYVVRKGMKGIMGCETSLSTFFNSFRF